MTDPSLAAAYFDSSGFVKLLVQQDGRDVAAQIWDGSDLKVSSRLADVEVRATLAGANRDHRLDDEGLAEAKRSWEDYWSDVLVVEPTAALVRSAGDVAERYALRGYDAVHLASALALGDYKPIVVAWDSRLRAGALAAGLAVAPAEPSRTHESRLR